MSEALRQRHGAGGGKWGEAMAEGKKHTHTHTPPPIPKLSLSVCVSMPILCTDRLAFLAIAPAFSYRPVAILIIRIREEIAMKQRKRLIGGE